MFIAILLIEINKISSELEFSNVTFFDFTFSMDVLTQFFSETKTKDLNPSLYSNFSELSEQITSLLDETIIIISLSLWWNGKSY